MGEYCINHRPVYSGHIIWLQVSTIKTGFTVLHYVFSKKLFVIFHRFEWDAFDYHSGIHSVQWKLFDNYTGSDEIHGQSHIHTQGNVDVSTDTCDIM